MCEQLYMEIFLYSPKTNATQVVSITSRLLRCLYFHNIMGYVFCQTKKRKFYIVYIAFLLRKCDRVRRVFNHFVVHDKLTKNSNKLNTIAGKRYGVIKEIAGAKLVKPIIAIIRRTRKTIAVTFSNTNFILETMLYLSLPSTSFLCPNCIICRKR